MSDKKENLKSLFTNTRTRIIIFLTTIVLLVGVGVGMFRIHKSVSVGDSGSAIESAPQGIQSVPGALNPTAQYAKLQKQQNLSNAEKALQQGSSSIPTLVSSQTFGKGIEQVGAKEGEGSLGFQ